MWGTRRRHPLPPRTSSGSSKLCGYSSCCSCVPTAAVASLADPGGGRSGGGEGGAGCGADSGEDGSDVEGGVAADRLDSSTAAAEPAAATGPPTGTFVFGQRGGGVFVQGRLLQSEYTLGRRMCYSHHIRSNVKRGYITKWAKELHLGGYSKIGYPGLIVVEGPEAGCQEYVSRLQRLQWKHFVVRGEEVVQVAPGCSLDATRLLPLRFEELGSQDMSLLASSCRDRGLETLFLTSMKIYR
eukprot:GHVU01194423.1.p2 GENE.GHVU01194423.1~~GHVU01194423.1.p2  ORF type:complete len:241 (+),score=35.47 GHVU01194423.1:473-1195(+)